MTSVREPLGVSAIGGVTVREPSGATIIGSIKGRDASNTLVTLFSAFGGGGDLSASPPSVSGYTSSHAPQRINTTTVTITVASGTVDAVAWSFDDAGWEAINPTSLTTAFRSPVVGPGDTATTTAHCTVTRGAVDASVAVDLTCSNFGS